MPSEKYKAITKVKSGKKPLKVAKKYGIPRNTIWTWLLPGKKEILKVFLICSLFEEEQVAFSPAKSSSQREQETTDRGRYNFYTFIYTCEDR